MYRRHRKENNKLGDIRDIVYIYMVNMIYTIIIQQFGYIDTMIGNISIYAIYR